MRPLLLTAAVCALAACDGGPPPGGGPLPDEVVAGVNLSALFAPPSNGERAAVRADWAARDADRDARYAYTTEPAVRAADGADLIVYTGRSAATGAVVHRGVVRLPPRPAGDVQRRPVVLVLPAHRAALTLDAALADLPLELSLRDAFVYVVLAYRGQVLDVEGTPYGSPADPAAAFDLDTEDGLALLSAVLAREPLADPARVAVAGYDRGGTAALLAAARGGPFDLVVSLAAPTDLFLTSVRQETRAYLRGEPAGRLPAFGDVAATVLEPLRGGGGDPATARRALLRRSPAYFASPPPFIYATHGALDDVVPVSHGRALRGVFGTEGAVYAESAEDDHGSLPGSSPVVATVTSLFIEHVLIP